MNYSYIFILTLCSLGLFVSRQTVAFQAEQELFFTQEQRTQEEENAGSGSSSALSAKTKATQKGIPTGAKATAASKTTPKPIAISRTQAQAAINKNKSNTGIAVDFPTSSTQKPAKPLSSQAGKTSTNTNESETFSYDNPLRSKQKTEPIEQTNVGFQSFDSSESIGQEERTSTSAKTTSSSKKHKQILDDQAAAKATKSSSGNSEEKPVFAGVTPSQKRSFSSTIEYTTKKIDTLLKTKPLEESGPLCLEALGIDSSQITKETLLEIFKQRESLRLSLQDTTKYEDISTPEALAKISSYRSSVKPADLAQINDVLARLSLPQITSNFSDAGKWFGSSGSEKFKTLTYEANQIISKISDKAEAYIREVHKKS